MIKTHTMEDEDHKDVFEKSARYGGDANTTSYYYGSRGEDFRALINSLLIKGRLKQKYINILISDENMKLYAAAFTSQKIDPANNYQYYEILGDAVAYQFMVWYFSRRFPHLDCAEGVQVLARLKIKYGAKQSFFMFAEGLGFWPYISTTEEDRNRIKKKLLEDVFEAFLGVTAKILDTEIREGVGYAITYDILKEIFDGIPISLKYDDLFDAKTRLKQLFDVYKDLGTLKYVEEKVDRITTSIVYRVDTTAREQEEKRKIISSPFIINFLMNLKSQLRNNRTATDMIDSFLREKDKKPNFIELGKGSAALKDDAQQRAADVAVKKLNSMGYVQKIPDIYFAK